MTATVLEHLEDGTGDYDALVAAAQGVIAAWNPEYPDIMLEALRMIGGFVSYRHDDYTIVETDKAVVAARAALTGDLWEANPLLLKGCVDFLIEVTEKEIERRRREDES
jgi:hypothetical protein